MYRERKRQAFTEKEIQVVCTQCGIEFIHLHKGTGRHRELCSGCIEANKHKKKVYFCEDCGVKFYSTRRLKRELCKSHRRKPEPDDKMPGKTLYSCVKCGEDFLKRKRNLPRDMQLCPDHYRKHWNDIGNGRKADKRALMASIKGNFNPYAEPKKEVKAMEKSPWKDAIGKYLGRGGLVTVIKPSFAENPIMFNKSHAIDGMTDLIFD